MRLARFGDDTFVNADHVKTITRTSDDAVLLSLVDGTTVTLRPASIDDVAAALDPRYKPEPPPRTAARTALDRVAAERRAARLAELSEGGDHS